MNWKHEIARDSLAFGSILFYAVVVIRAIIGDYMPFVYQLLVALLIIVALNFVTKANNHVARAVPLVVFTSLFYQDNLFTAFVILLFIFILGSAIYIKVKKSEIAKGVVMGLIASLVAYYLVSVLLQN